MLQEAGSDLTEVRFLCVVLLLQISNKPQLESVDVLNVPEYDFQLVIVKHVPSFFALSKVTLQRQNNIKERVRVVSQYVYEPLFVNIIHNTYSTHFNNRLARL